MLFSLVDHIYSIFLLEEITLKNLKHTFSDLGISFLFLFSFIGLGLLFVLLFRPLYLFDLHFFNLPETTGYSKEEILLNYDYLIRTCLPFFHDTFQFPTMPSSASGIQHFEEVRHIFYTIYALSFSSIVLLVPILRQKKKNQDFRYLKFSGILVLILPVLLAVLSIISFHTVFVTMHTVLFRNDLWLFDPDTDPIINILPEEYFFHCAAALFLFLIAGGILLLLRYHHQYSRSTHS